MSEVRMRADDFDDDRLAHGQRATLVEHARRLRQHADAVPLFTRDLADFDSCQTVMTSCFNTSKR